MVSRCSSTAPARGSTEGGSTTAAGRTGYVLNPLLCVLLFSFAVFFCAEGVKIRVFYFALFMHMQKGCDFWHWELQYVMYLMEKDYLVGERAAETFAWAEERREKLELKNRQGETRGEGHEDRPTKTIGLVTEQLTEVVLLLKLVVVLMVVGCLLLVQSK